MTLQLVKPGGWSNLELLTSDQLDALQAELIKAIDGVGGGTYELDDPLIFDGAEVRFAAIARFLAGSTLVIEDLLSMASGSDADFNNGSTLSVETGSAINLQGGMNVLAGADVVVEDLDDLTVDDDVQTYTLTLSGAYWEHDGSNEDTWTLTRNEAPGNWLQHIVTPASGAQLFFPLRVEPGDVINSITMIVIGGIDDGHAALPAGLPELTLVEIDGGGLATEVATEQDTSASQAAYDASHSIVLNAGTTGGTFPYTAISNGCYLVRVNGERSTNAEPDELVILRIQANITRKTLIHTGII